MVVTCKIAERRALERLNFKMHHHCRHHHQGEAHAHHDGKSFEEANKQYFTENVGEFEKPQNTELAKRAANVFREHHPFSEETTVVMDFACGTGLISRELAPYTKKIVGIDITQAFVDNYNKRVSDQGIPSDEMCAICTELKGKEGELDGLKFDVIVCSASYHHFPSVEDITKTLAFFLKPGGSLLVIDIIDPSDPLVADASSDSVVEDHLIPEKYHHIVPHTRGFTSAKIREVFEGAGLTSFAFDKAMKAKMRETGWGFDEPKDAGLDVTFFIAKGEKASA